MLVCEKLVEMENVRRWLPFHGEIAASACRHSSLLPLHVCIPTQAKHLIPYLTHVRLLSMVIEGNMM